MKPYKNINRGGKTHSEHKWVWEQANGPVPEGHVVHHINGVKRDNRLENLMLMTHQEHSEHHNQLLPKVKPCSWCGSDFSPHPTKRRRALTCSRECFRLQLGRSRSRIPAEVRLGIIEDRKAGMTLMAIASKRGVSFSSAQRLAKAPA